MRLFVPVMMLLLVLFWLEFCWFGWPNGGSGIPLAAEAAAAAAAAAARNDVPEKY